MQYKMTFEKRAEARRLAREFKRFVECSATKTIKDFRERFGVSHSRFYYYMKWANENLRDFDYESLKKTLRDRTRRMGY